LALVIPKNRCGRPTVLLEIRRLIRKMSIANPLWRAPAGGYSASSISMLRRGLSKIGFIACINTRAA
jgi:hypothetical protein